MNILKTMTLSIAFTILAFVTAANASEQVAESDKEDIFIQINDLIISESEFENIFNAAVRYKYYHGRVPESEIIAFRQQVAEDLVIQTLVYTEALSQGLEPDRDKIQEGIESYDLKYGNSSEWQNQREKVMPLLAKRLERQDLIEKMEARVKDLPQPGESQKREYYLDHPEKFTEPKRVWLSLILLSVPPSGGSTMWNEALKVAEQLKTRIGEGEEFSELVKAYSDHISAASGGDLGYLHQGMLDPDTQKAVEALAINEVSAPIRVLEGITLFRLNGVQSGGLKPFDEVKSRVSSLLYRELQELAWNEHLNALKSSANIFVNKKLTVLTSHE